MLYLTLNMFLHYLVNIGTAADLNDIFIAPQTSEFIS